jgi:hypothetical protein
MQIAFFPWLFLNEPITLEPLTFLPLRDKDRKVHLPLPTFPNSSM